MEISDIQTILEVASVIAYCIVLLVIVTSKKDIFKTAFYLIFVATGVADIISIFVNGFARMNRQLKLGPQYQHIASFCIWTSGVVFIVHMVGNLIICFNRYSAVCLAQNYDKIWTRRNTWILILSEYVLSIIAMYHTIGAPVTYIHNPDGSYTFIGLEKHLDVVNRFIYFAVCLLYAFASVIMNGFLLYGLKSLSELGDYTQHEKGLLIYTLVVFVSSLLMCAQQIGRVFAVTTNNVNMLVWISLQFFWINDVMISIPPFSLFALSSDLRQAFIDVTRCRHRSQNDVVLPLSTSNF